MFGSLSIRAWPLPSIDALNQPFRNIYRAPKMLSDYINTDILFEESYFCRVYIFVVLFSKVNTNIWSHVFSRIEEHWSKRAVSRYTP